MMKLYGFPQTRSSRATWALEEAGAEYEYVLVNLRAGEHKKPAFLAINPFGKIPTLVDDGQAISESAAICTHIAEKFPDDKRIPEIANTSYWEFEKAAAVLSAHLKSRQYIASKQFSAADIICVSVLHWAHHVKVNLDETLLNYMNKHSERPALARAKKREADAT